MAYINTKTFIEVYPTSDDFISSFRSSGMSDYIKEDKYLGITYELLLSKYEKSHIASLTDTSFKSKVNATIFQYGPIWIKKLEIQDRLVSLTEAEIMAGSVAKTTGGYNPSNVPGTANSDTEIETVNQQSLQKYTKSKLDAYAGLNELLKTNVTNTYLNQFKKLFMNVIDVDDIISTMED